MNLSQIEPLEARIAPATLSIANVSVTEGNSVNSIAQFTVTLSEAATDPVTVNFATSNDTTAGAATTTGPFADYVAKSGTLTFAPGTTQQTIDISIIADTYKEADEVFKVTLSGASGAGTTIDTAEATGTILNGGDTAVGFAMSDAQKVEGGTASSLIFQPTLSAALGTDVTFKIATRAGTAAAGSDFGAQATTLTIPAGQLSTNFTVDIKGDANFETAENFFVSVSGLPGTVTPVNKHAVDPGAQLTAVGTILDDDAQLFGTKELRWTDIDGDLVSLTVNNGTLANALGQANPAIFTFVAKGTTGGQELQFLNLNGGLFAGASVTITATKQSAFPGTSDGRVNVGYIKAAEFNASELEAFGVDLGVVTVDGDLGRIQAGDQFSTPAISKLNVYSLGAQGTATQQSSDASIESKVLGPIGTVSIETNLNGFLHVIGAEFGTIGTLNITKALQGGSLQNSGVVSVSGRIGSATIGSIAGGSQDSTGLLLASFLTGKASLGTIHVLGNVTGGTGKDSGAIEGPKIGNVTIDGSLSGSAGEQSGYLFSSTTLGNVKIGGDLRGGSGANAGELAANTKIGAVAVTGKIVGAGGLNSGSIRAAGNVTSLQATSIAGGSGEASGSVQLLGGNIGAVTLGKDGSDSIFGGSGLNSGQITVAGNIASVTTTGNVKGSTGAGSGGLIAGGTISKIVIGDSLVGGSPTTVAASTYVQSGFIKATSLPSVTVTNDILAGTNVGPGNLDSGAIRADVIGALKIGRDVTGTASSSVFITAGGLANNLAIKSVQIGGKVKLAEILAGYSGGAAATNSRGVPVNGDASIGTIDIAGTAEALDIVAGAIPGTDARFGAVSGGASTDDRSISAPAGRNLAGTISQIASVIIRGDLSTVTNAGFYGIVAQSILSVKLGPNQTSIALHPGASNDIPIKLGGTGSNFYAAEIPQP